MLIVFLLGLALGFYFVNNQKIPLDKSAEKNTPKAFISEVYDKIKANYWDNLSDGQLIDMFKTASSALGSPLSSKIESKDELIKKLDSSKAAKLVSQVLASLPPAGRSGLYTEKQETALKNTVENVNPEKDLYKDLGLSKGASEGAVLEAYEKLPPTQKEQLSYARDVLTQKDKKARYDQKGVEPTIFTKILGNTLYLQFKKFSPTSYDEFIKTFDDFKNEALLNSLVLDLRGNVGGAIDATPYFLGLFLGKNQYAYDFYHRGAYEPFKTPTDKLPSLGKYKQMVILVDNATQSSAEMMAASLKRYHLGVVVGVPTKGWGTVERVFPLENQFEKGEKYSLFLVHSITLRDDNQPIEGRGVDPDINIKATDWPQQLFSYFRNNQLIDAVKGVL